MSLTKDNILDVHHQNHHLNAALPPIIPLDDEDLSADGMRLPLDERVIEAAATALEEGQTHYVDVPGIMPLREAIAGHMRQGINASFQAENVIVTAGMQESRFLSIQKIGENFDAVAYPAASHPGIRKALGVRSRNPVALPVDPDNGYLAPVDSIEREANNGGRLIVLESPSRLTGAIYSADDVAAIAQIIADNDAGLIWDCGISPWIDSEYAAPAAYEDEAQRIVIIGELFPGMGLDSWYIGCIAAPEQWIAPMQSQKQIMAICTSTASQYAALKASDIAIETHGAKWNALRTWKEAALAVAEANQLDVIAGSAQNIMALRLDSDQMAALDATGCEFGVGADYGAAGLARLNITSRTAEFLSAIS